jgi:hypothetical protein
MTFNSDFISQESTGKFFLSKNGCILDIQYKPYKGSIVKFTDVCCMMPNKGAFSIQNLNTSYCPVKDILVSDFDMENGDYEHMSLMQVLNKMYPKSKLPKLKIEYNAQEPIPSDWYEKY